MKVKKPRPFDISGAQPIDTVSEEPASLETLNAPTGSDVDGFDIPGESSTGAPSADDEPSLRPLRMISAAEDKPPARSFAASTQAVVVAPRGWPIYTAATVVSALWALAPIMFAWGYRQDVVPFQNDLFALLVFCLLAVGPAALVWIAAYILHQGLRLASEMRRAQALAESFVQPAAQAALGAGSAAESVRREIEQATTAAGVARTELLALRDVVAAESQRLIEATQASGRTASALTVDLGAEREKMAHLASVLDAQAAGVMDAINRHARMVAEASDLAETQIREAEAALAARAADLAAAAGEASDAARNAGDDLSRQVARLETAGLGVGDQVRIVEEGLTEQRAALIAAAHGMRADHEAFAAEAESHLAQIQEVMLHTRTGASVMAEKAEESAESLRTLIASTANQLHHLAQSAAEERDLLATSAAQSLGAFSQVASQERQMLEQQTREAIDHLIAAAEEAGRAAALQAEIARDKVDQLGEAAFAAGQKADAAFEARLNEARGLIEQSAQLIADAGDRATHRLNEGLGVARSTLSELEELLADVDARVAQLPAEAHARAESVRQSIERGMDDLMVSARKAAEETQSIDAAFQDRVRRNYDMLSEAVRLMGVVAGAAGGPSPRPPPPRNTPPERPRHVFERPTPSPAAAQPRYGEAKNEASPRAEEPVSADAAGLRPRLKLTPTATDEEFKTVFDAAGGREASDADDSWTWKELLSSMEEAPADDDAATQGLLNEIEAMGIDAAALLPRLRIDEIAAALRDSGIDGSRPILRRLAPAAIRRLSRRMMSDRAFQAQVDRFTRRYQGLLADNINDGGNAVVVSALLGSDQGRAYLLFDAAVGDAS